MKRMNIRFFKITTIFLLVAGGWLIHPFMEQGVFAETTEIERETQQYLKYEETLQLTPAQKEVRKRALSGIAAPCCRTFPMETCCCDCNLAKSVWGLTKHLIVHQRKTNKEIETAVRKWISKINSEGFAGDACFKGRCNLPFEKDGCNGMGSSGV